nr:sodium/calcium exchanger membrane region, calcium binding protein 2 [Tanacetum cinerariifolium]
MVLLDTKNPFYVCKEIKDSTSEEQCQQISMAVSGCNVKINGESYAGGDGRIFHVLGNNFFASSFSRLLDCLPESLILLGQLVYLIRLKNTTLLLSYLFVCYYFYYQYYEDKRIHDRILEYAELGRKIEMHAPYYEGGGGGVGMFRDMSMVSDGCEFYEIDGEGVSVIGVGKSDGVEVVVVGEVKGVLLCLVCWGAKGKMDSLNLTCLLTNVL